MPRTSLAPGPAMALLLFAAPGASTDAGALDPGFGDEGIAVVAGNPALPFQTAKEVMFQPDGRILVGGRYLSPDGDTDFFVARHFPETGRSRGYVRSISRATHARCGIARPEPRQLAPTVGDCPLARVQSPACRQEKQAAKT